MIGLSGIGRSVGLGTLGSLLRFLRGTLLFLCPLVVLFVLLNLLGRPYFLGRMNVGCSRLLALLTLFGGLRA